MEKVVRQVCQCVNCGNESEMEITCTLPDVEPEKKTAAPEKDAGEEKHKVKGTATCSHCGNEADMWIDL